MIRRRGAGGVVFDGELDHLRKLRAMDAGEQGESHVNADRYASGGDHLSAFRHPLLGVTRTPASQLFGACPVSAGLCPSRIPAAAR